MKKLFLLLLAVMAVFSLVFTACEGVTNPDFITEGYTKIDDPVISARAYEGAILVSWLPVKDAKTYTLIRRDNETLAVTAALTPNYGSYGYLDVIGYNNELVDGRSYTYTVVATHNNSINNAPATEVEIPILNGKGETTVSAWVPAEYTVPAIADFTTSEVTGINGYDWLKVSWVAGTYNPAVNVEVTYSYGKDQPGLLTVSVPTIGTKTQGSSYALFPLIGGENTVSVQPVFGSPNSADASLLGTYYASPAKVEKTVTYSKTSLGDLGDDTSKAFFNATQVGIANSGNPAVQLSYRDFAGVEGATPSVYRLEAAGATSGAATSLQTGATVTGWTAINPGFVKRSVTGAFNGFEYYAEDTTVEAGKSYVYALVLSLDTAKSQAATASVTVTKTTVPQATITNFTITPVNVLNSTGDITGTRLQIRFEGDKTSTYKVQFAPNIGEGETTTTAKAGTYTDVPDAATTVDPTGIITVGHNPPRRVAYFYKVIGTNADGIIREVLYGTNGLYSVGTYTAEGPIYWSALTSLLPSTGASATKNFSVPATGKAAAGAPADTLIFPEESVKIYYAPTDSGAELTTYTNSVTFTYANFTNVSDSTVRTKQITVSGELEYRNYAFKAFLVTAGGKEILIQ